MEKILYLMNVDWNWIKQRPHFIAEGLSADFDVTIVYQRRYSRKGYQKRNLPNNVKCIFTIPFIDRINGLRIINTAIKRLYISFQIWHKKPDAIYTTSPEQIEWIPKSYTGPVLYDCMDDHAGLAVSENKKKRLLILEEKLYRRADTVIASSMRLVHSLVEKYGEKEIHVIRNGYDRITASQPDTDETHNPFTICYFGTISSWFDFELINECLRVLPNIEFLLIGPLHNGVDIPQDRRVKYIGTVEHSELQEKTRNADCFIMPFVLNDAILAVDPVKLYEYINFNKNIICVYYPEVERFGPFCHFYRNKAECVEIIRKLEMNNTRKYSEAERKAFLQKNTWSGRAHEIKELLLRESDHAAGHQSVKR